MSTYEIWGHDNTLSQMDGGDPQFRENCETIEDAYAALHEWQTDGRAAWIIEITEDFSPSRVSMPT